MRALMPEMGVRVGVAVTARLDTTSPGVDDPPSLFKEWVRLMHEAAGLEKLPVFAGDDDREVARRLEVW